MSTLSVCGTQSGLADRDREGIGIGSVDAGTPVTIQTRYSTYELIVRDGARHDVLLRGGRLFPAWTEARLNGSTAGGSALKSGWIGIGLRIEIAVGGKRFTTSPVQSIWIERTSAVA
jgi:hypothetical protein